MPEFFASRAAYPEERRLAGPFLFTFDYFLLKISPGQSFLHREQPTQKNGLAGPFLFTFYSFLLKISPGQKPSPNITKSNLVLF